MEGSTGDIFIEFGRNGANVERRDGSKCRVHSVAGIFDQVADWREV